MSNVAYASAQNGFAWTGDWKVIGSINQGFIQPKGIAKDKSNNIYVVDPSNSRVYKYSNSTWSYATGPAFTVGSDYPIAIAVDGSGNLYVVNSLYNSTRIIFKYTVSSGTWTDITYSRRFKNPSGIAVDSQGNIYVADSGNNAVVRSNGITSWEVIGDWISDLIGNPVGICVDNSNNVYITMVQSPLPSIIKKYNSSTDTWSVPFNSSANNILNATSITIDNNGNAYVTNADTNFKYIATLLNGSSEWAYINGNFNETYGVAVDNKGNIYVTDVNIGDTANSSIKMHQPWAYQLSWATQPGGAMENGALNPQPSVKLQDILGNTLLYNSGESASIDLSTSGGAYLSGTTSAPLASGIAQFSNLSIDKAGTYNLVSDISFQNKNYWNYSTGPSGIPVTLTSANSNNIIIKGQVVTPTASIAAGTTVAMGTVITFSSATSGSKIYYTTDGSTPTTTSLSGTQVAITGSPGSAVSLKLMATSNGMANSDVAVYSYTLQSQVVTPTASITSGNTVANNTVVTLASTTSGSTIYYTTDGTTPTTSSLYGTQVAITGSPSSTVVLKLMATANGMANSEVAVYSYTLQSQVVTPTASIATGTTVAMGTVVTFSSATSGSKIYYTTDGSTPTTTSLSGTQVAITGSPGSDVSLKLMATATGMANSDVAVYTYTLQPQVATPTASIATGTTVAMGTVITFSSATSGSKIYYTTDGSTPTTTSLSGTQVAITGSPSSTVVLKLMATANNMTNSEVAVYTYTLQSDYTINTVKFAAQGSTGVFANRIGWIDFGKGFTLFPGANPVHIINSITAGYTVEFDINLVDNDWSATVLNAIMPPANLRAPFGNTGYTGIDGYVVLYSPHTNYFANQTVEISNIVVKNSKGIKTTTYKFVAADAETTDERQEVLRFYTDNSVWGLLDNLPSTTGTPNAPIISGVGSNTVQETGVEVFPWSTNGPVFATNTPTSISATMMFSYGTQQGIAFGIIITEREQAITDLIESIALEQTALSHILNAEGEKIQKVIKTATSQSDMITLNSSVKSMVSSITTLEMVLQGKLGLFENCLDDEC